MLNERNLRACLRKLLNFALPRSEQLRRVCHYQFLEEIRNGNKKFLTRRLKYILSRMSVRDIALAFKKGFFPGEIVTVVAEKLRGYGLDTSVPARLIMRADNAFRERQRCKFFKVLCFTVNS